jgi:hypothetical protein
MKRLRELEPDNRLMSRAHELIDAMGPTLPSEARLIRVRQALDQPVRRPLGRWAARGALAFAVVAGGASALAFSGAFSAVPEPSPAGARTPPAAPAAQGPKALPPPISDRDESVEAAAPPKLPAAPRLRRSAGTPSANASDVARIHEAAKALRGDGDPERALKLLESSEKAGGPLAEEALALRIEAATAGGDPRAKSLAQSYLSRYPSGRYRELARRTLAEH